mmetsp:Transcript_75758/g.190511  ORF Transcript_75758/g.190511 Transcript_75758/m.190511 type:complete len:212 (-) Transcript_75758:810-1445(-)
MEARAREGLDARLARHGQARARLLPAGSLGLPGRARYRCFQPLWPVGAVNGCQPGEARPDPHRHASGLQAQPHECAVRGAAAARVHGQRLRDLLVHRRRFSAVLVLDGVKVEGLPRLGLCKDPFWRRHLLYRRASEQQHPGAVPAQEMVRVGWHQLGDAGTRWSLWNRTDHTAAQDRVPLRLLSRGHEHDLHRAATEALLGERPGDLLVWR